MIEEQVTKRKEILNRLKEDMEDLGIFDSVLVRQPGLPDLEKVQFPCVFIYSGVENRLTDQRSVIGYETWEWRVNIEVWEKGEEDQNEDILALIHKKLYDDSSLGGHCEYCERLGSDFWVLEPEHFWSSMIVPYTILYRHLNGVM